MRTKKQNKTMKSKSNLLFNISLCLVLFTVIFNPVKSNDEEDENKAKEERQSRMISLNFEKCLRKENEAVSGPPRTYCPKEFDRILCWEETPANQWAYQQCPEYVIGFANIKDKARRFCQEDGIWMLKPNSTKSYTDYRSCIEDKKTNQLLHSHLPILKMIGKVGSILSLGSLIFAISLLSALKRLHCARNILHINLFASFLLFSILNLIKDVFWVMSVGFPKDVIMGNGTVDKVSMNPNVSHWECKLLISFSRYAESSNHVMVFCEALYLNTLISVSTFSENNHFKFYILAGWIGPLFWIIPFIILMATLGNPNSCWNTETKFTYMHVVPQVALIFMNFFLFVNIVRILQNKLRKNRLTDSKQYRYKKLAKSTLILLPLFSIYYIAFSVWQPFVRGKLAIEFELIRLYFEIICSSFQGLAISLIYSFFNTEVRTEMLRQIDNLLMQHYPNMNGLSSYINSRDRTQSSLSLNRVNKNHVDVSNSKINSSSKGGKKKKEQASKKDVEGEFDFNNNSQNLSIGVSALVRESVGEGKHKKKCFACLACNKAKANNSKCNQTIKSSAQASLENNNPDQNTVSNSGLNGIVNETAVKIDLEKMLTINAGSNHQVTDSGAHLDIDPPFIDQDLVPTTTGSGYIKVEAEMIDERVVLLGEEMNTEITTLLNTSEPRV